MFDLNYELSRRLYQVANPIRICERRDYSGHSRETILTGMSVRVADGPCWHPRSWLPGHRRYGRAAEPVTSPSR